MSLRKLRNTDRIQNIQSNTPKPVIGSWKKYWCDQSGELWPETCRFRGCGDNADGSAHVIVNYDEDFEYIIPICDDHREISEIFSVNSGTLAVRIDKEEIITELVENLVEKYGKLHLKGGMRVQNIQGTNVCHPRGRKRGTWKKFWLRHSDSEWPSLCRVRHCMEQAEGGAHVRMKKKCGVFIVPMCGKHNNAQNQDWYSVEEHTIAVRVDEEDTSGPVGPCYL
ncbi:Hypothetical predicted protein [Paramuricea clavata]|nr:Hypothetical predicted protein [Paramuricea clavata]